MPLPLAVPGAGRDMEEGLVARLRDQA